MKHRRRPSPAADVVVLICFVAIVATGTLLAMLWFDPAHASVGLNRPYGGCKEATVAPHSAAADQCRDRGWTIRPRLAVTPHGVVAASALPHCREEDGSGQRSACSWNFHDGTQDGDGKGLSLWWDRHDRVHYVWPASPLHDQWMWVDQELGDALAEGDHHEDNWETCITNGVHHHRIRVQCPDGFGQTA